VLHDLPAVRVACRRARVPDLEDAVEELFETLEADVARTQRRASGPPILIYHDRDHRDRDADVEAAVPIIEGAARVGRSKVRTLPPVPLAACIVYSGSYQQWGAIMRQLLKWLEMRRLVPAGPLRELFLQFGARDPKRLELPPEYIADRPEDLVTEMQIPVRRRRGGRGLSAGRHRKRPGVSS
jgi:effector-binding domain-containing protein